MKAYYIDSYSYESLHEMYNASSLKMFSHLYDEIVYAADISSKNNVQLLLNGFPSNIMFTQLYLPYGRKTKINRLFSQVLAIIYNSYFILKANRNDTIIFNYNTMVAIYFVNLLTMLTKKKTLVVCHGEMQALCMQKSTSKIFKLSQKFFTNEKQKIADNLYFAVLGDVILKNLKPYISNKIFQKFKSFDHSAIFNDATINTNISTKLKIGAIGILRESKGLSSLISLASNLKEQNNLEISIIGRLNSRKQEIINAGIVLPNKNVNLFLNRIEMYDLIMQLDLILFLYPSDGYKITASGALFDAIACERPILALRNDYFEYFFNKYGSVGCLVDTYEDLENEITKLIDGERYKVNFSDLKQKLSPERIAVSFRESLQEINFL